MESLNKIELCGPISNVSYTDVQDKTLIKFSIATTYASTCSDGNTILSTTWFVCSAWKDIIKTFDTSELTNGTWVHITGRLKANEVDCRVMYEVICQTIELAK